jgi:hypothetical protein
MFHHGFLTRKKYEMTYYEVSQLRGKYITKLMKQLKVIHISRHVTNHPETNEAKNRPEQIMPSTFNMDNLHICQILQYENSTKMIICIQFSRLMISIN